MRPANAGASGDHMQRPPPSQELTAAEPAERKVRSQTRTPPLRARAWVILVQSLPPPRQPQPRQVDAYNDQRCGGDECRGRLRAVGGADAPGGNKSWSESSLTDLLSATDPTASAHALERRPHYCNLSHRVRSNLLIVFAASNTALTLLSVGTCASTQAEGVTSKGQAGKLL